MSSGQAVSARAASAFERSLARAGDGRLLGYGLLGPAILALVALMIGPLVYAVVLSAYSWRLTEINLPKVFVGLENYQAILGDTAFIQALRNTVLLVVAAVAVELVLGFVIAYALYHMRRGRRVASGIILLPMIITPVVAALIWRYLLDPQFGLVNMVIGALGGSRETGWLSSPALALPSIVLVDVWQWTPFVILVLHAGLLAIPDSLLEAARVDGASAWQTIRLVMLPYLTPLVLIVLLFRTMDTYRTFDTVFVLTKGGPGLATETVGLYTYRSGFIFFEMGYAMALAVVVLALIVVISSFYLRLLRRRT